MNENSKHLAYLKNLYQKGIISKSTYERASRDINNKKNKLVTIKSTFNNKYVSVNGEDDSLIANKIENQLSDRFILKDLGNGNVLIQTQEGYYVKIDSKNDMLVASASEKKDATIFTLIPINNKEVALKSDNGYYVKVGDNGYLIANDAIQSEKTAFKIKEVTKIEYTDIVMISVLEERFVTAIEGGGSYLSATSFNQTVNEDFNILQFLDGNFVIQTDKGYYVRIDNNNVLIADTMKLEEASLFRGENLGDFVTVIKTLNGEFITVRSSDKYLVVGSNKITEASKFNIYKSVLPI